ncbi:MAG: hypothetical protein ACOC80_15310, partial [Petrotogales bacterium]
MSWLSKAIKKPVETMRNTAGFYVPGGDKGFVEQMTGGAFGSGSSNDEMPDTPEPMDYEKAYKQAEDVLQPEFEQQQQDLSKQQVNRGFYGQMPGDVMQQELAGQQESQLAQQATDIQQQDWQRNMQEYEAEMGQYQQEEQEKSNFWGTVGGIAGSFLGGPGGGAVGSWAGNKIGE